MLIIPAIDIINGKTVRLTKGDYNLSTFYDADPVDMVKRYLDHGFNRIHSVDLDGAKASSPVNLKVLEKMASIDGAKIEWSGGIKTLQDACDARNAGASFLSVGSVAARQPELFKEMLKEYGPDFMILSADEKDGKIAVKGWTEETEFTVVQLVEKFLPSGLSQAIVTDISRDGTFSGIDVDFYRGLQDRFPEVDFTVSGGVGGIEDIERAQEAGLRRIIVGKAIYENRISLNALRQFNL
ncbi:MAG: 1-(5-phosphoribosyl)-5-[(5-phosphoribosylamino)methylideneamino]imidazole-4-carboxamide isomerase [Muribaculaceae bacterium]|nr:1-(5-phosphoribosyl)-5-[(5-phosphoribosylamino)methylideneamino]imidazole-4-carboxamide isomerase [Muribaculaceae bacterium]